MYLKRFTQEKIALGSNIRLSFVGSFDDTVADSIFEKMWRAVFEFERRFSRFLPMSELVIFNRTTGLRTAISLDMQDILLSAKKYSEITNGIYNPFILPVLQKIGYRQSAVEQYKFDKQPDYTNRRVVTTDKLEIGDGWAMIPYGTAIDLGGIGKGYLANQLSRILDDLNVTGYWLSLGGDIIAKGQDENGNDLLIDIQKADKLTATTDFLINFNGQKFAVATSAALRRDGQSSMGDNHHIINPKTESSAATDIIMATVVCDDAARADVMAKCAIILGSNDAINFLKNQSVNSALIQYVDKNGNLKNKKFGRNIARIETYKSREFALNA